jgi:hypothetical protein
MTSVIPLTAMNSVAVFSLQNRVSATGFGLVLASIILSWIAAIVLGGFRIGSLERRVAHSVGRDRYDTFWNTIQQRLTELGFRPGGADGVYVQSGGEFGNMETFTHAKTKKELRVTSHDDAGTITVELSLRYLDPILGDSGESAYRDAVLDYVSGQRDTMQIVPNLSFGALSGFIGGLVACAAVFILKSIDFKPVVPPILVLTVSEIGIAILALVSIRRKPRELKGGWLAVAGIALSLAATVGAIIL